MAWQSREVLQTHRGPRTIVRYVYSAILDSVVCDLCRALDGRVVLPGSPEHRMFTPPLHQNCRCIWIGITSHDPNIPSPHWPPLNESLIDKFGSLMSFRKRGEKPSFSRSYKQAIEEVWKDGDGKFEVVIACDDSGRRLLKKAGSKTQVEFSWREMRLFEKAHLIHNHPRGVGLSAPDVGLAVVSQMRSITAVGDKFEYQLILSDEFYRYLSKKGFVFWGRRSKRPSLLVEHTYQKMIKVYRDIEREVREQLDQKLMKGKIRVEEACLLHHHLVLERFVKVFPGLRYIRRKRK